MNTTWTYDIECLPNWFSAIFINIDTKQKHIDEYIAADIRGDIQGKKEALSKCIYKEFIIYNDINQAGILISFVKSSKCETLIGYNSIKYDNLIIDYIILNLNIDKSPDIITAELYSLSQDIISYQDIGNYRKEYDLKYSNKYISIDLMKLHYLDRKRISLKQVSIALKWYRVEEYTPLPMTDKEMKDFNYVSRNIPWYERYVIDTHFPHVIDYNINDVLITLKLHRHGIAELRQRVNISVEYEINVLSESRSSSADRLLSKFYQDATGLRYWDFYTKKTFRRKIDFNDLIAKYVNFKSNELSSFLVYLKTIVINIGTDTFSEILLYKGTKYKFAKGGLHSVDVGAVYKKENGYSIIDYDFRN